MPKFLKTIFYSNREEKEKFLNQYRDVYRRLGYKTEEAIDQVIQSQLDANDIPEDEYEDAMKKLEIMNAAIDLEGKKYYHFRGSGVDAISRLGRAMFLPETSVSNVTYNELMARKFRTKEGVTEVLQEAMVLLNQVTPEIFEAAKKDHAVYMQYQQGIMLGLVARNVLADVESMRETIAKEKGEVAAEKAFPKAVIQHLGANKLYYQGFSEVEFRMNLYGNKYHYVVPLNTGVEVIANYVEKNKDEDMENLFSQRNKEARGGTEPFLQPDEACKAYYEDIRKRMENERLNMENAAVRVSKMGKRTDFLQHVTSLGRVHVEVSVKQEHLKEIREKNAEWLKDSTAEMLKTAGENYNRSFGDAADEMAEILQAGSIRTHSNKNYKAMLKQMALIRDIAQKGDMRDLSKADRRKLEEALKALDRSAEEYLQKKMGDKSEFSPKAKERIRAARLCCTFVKGRMADLTLVQNKDLKRELAMREPFTEADAKREWDRAADEYAVAKDLGSFVECLTYSELATGALKGGKTMFRGEVNDLYDMKMQMYQKLYDDNEAFHHAVHTGDFKTARSTIQTVVTDLYKQRELERVQRENRLMKERVAAQVKAVDEADLAEKQKNRAEDPDEEMELMSESFMEDLDDDEIAGMQENEPRRLKRADSDLSESFVEQMLNL